MKYFTIFATFLVIVVYFDTCSAHDVHLCEYKNFQGEIITLKFLPYVNRGQSYYDVGDDGLCLKRVKCWEGSTLKVEECSDTGVTCDNVAMYNYDYFPTCCIKC